jgi:hypothetical protein
MSLRVPRAVQSAPLHSSQLTVNHSPQDIAIVVLSCDRYSDLWQPYFDAFFDQWPDCPFPVYLAANEAVFDHPRVRTLKSGPDRDWSSSVLSVLRQVPNRRVLTLFEDFFLVHRIDTDKVLRLADWAARHDYAYLRFYASPKPDEASDNPEVGRLAEQAPYRATLCSVVWDKEFLMSLIRPGESAWVYEFNSLDRAANNPHLYCTFEHVIETLHGVEKGLWFPAALKEMCQLGYVKTPPTRGSWTQQQVDARVRAARFRGHVRRALPAAIRPYIHRLLWKWYRFSGKIK